MTDKTDAELVTTIRSNVNRLQGERTIERGRITDALTELASRLTAANATIERLRETYQNCIDSLEKRDATIERLTRERGLLLAEHEAAEYNVGWLRKFLAEGWAGHSNDLPYIAAHDAAQKAMGE